MTTTLTLTSGQSSFTAQGYTILPSPGTAVPDGVASAIISAAYGAGVVLSSSAGTGVVNVPSRRFTRSGTGPPQAGEGRWLLGDEIVDSAGAQFECTAAGDPGTWVAQSGASALVPTAVKTSAYTAAVGDLIPIDTTSGPVTVTLPAAPADKAQVAVKLVVQGAGNNVTITRGGSSDVFNKAAGSTSLTLSTQNQSMTLQYKASGGIWYVLSDSLSLAALNSLLIPAPASPADGQLVAWNATTSQWVATNPTGSGELAYAANVTGTATTASTTAVDIPGATITVPASTRPVYLKCRAAVQQTVVGSGDASLYLYETTSGSAVLLTNFLVPLPNNVSPNVCFVDLPGEIRIGPVASTRTFKLALAIVNYAAGATAKTLNTAANPSWLAALAR